MVVEVRHVLGQHYREMAAVDDQYLIQQFEADSSGPSFGDRICPGRPHRCAQDTNSLTGEHGIENAGELAVAVPDQQRELNRAIAEVDQKVARLLRNPGTARVRGDPREGGRGGPRAPP